MEITTELKFLKFKSGEEVISEIKGASEKGVLVLYRPAVLFYNEEDELVLSAWIWQSQDEIFRIETSDLLIPPCSVIPHLEDTYKGWTDTVSKETLESVLPIGMLRSLN